MACKENDSAGSTFLARLAIDWEATTKPLDKSNTRLVIARLAPVLAKTHPPASAHPTLNAMLPRHDDRLRVTIL